jgi:alkylation response protein AidB-like acyl-CoA dehydrogenase
MDFRLGSKSDAFRAEVRAFLQEHATPEMIERCHRSGTLHDWEFHRALGKKGWIAASWPKDLGGQGRDAFEMAAFDEEAAHVPMDGLGITLMVANTLRHVGTEEQKAEILPRFLSGEAIAALGYSEPGSGSDVAAARTRAVRDGKDWLINGEKVFTTLAHEAQYVFLLTRTDASVPKHKGLTMFLVPMNTPGIDVKPIYTLGTERTNSTYYTDVRVPDSCRVGEVNGGWNVMMIALTYERASAQGREGVPVLQDFIAWAREARDQDGRRIIDDPSVRETIARVAIRNEVSILLALRSTWVSAMGGMPGVEGSMAKLFTSEAFQRSCSEMLGHQGHAGLAQRGEPEAAGGGWVEAAHRHAAVTTIAGGSSEIQRGIIAARGLGLPRVKTET